MRDPRYDILFEPVKIGPVTTRNRFYQVPHCSALGHRFPEADARMRGIKAEGGWGVVSTQEAEIHPTSDLTPSSQARLWDDQDIPALQMVVDAIHEHGSLAAIELVHNGLHTSNRYSRLSPIAPSHVPVDSDDPVQARAMSKADIVEFRRWHADAARRAKDVGFDIVYVYAGHNMTLLQHFLLARHNHRIDEYGGSLENRLRLFREVISDTRDAIGDTCALAIRFAVDELLGDAGLRHDNEARDVIEAIAEEPDLWDVNLSDWSNDSQSSRFSQEGFQEDYIGFVKSMTSKPVVGVGRYTSPDAMVKAINSGIMDLIGAARPSIADPFLPNKIERGDIDDIRECIGCNICVAFDNICAPVRCTQNPTMGEEWRLGWHPEIISAINKPDTYLVVGGGPAGLEASRALAQRSANVIIAESGSNWGGRVTRESALPGLAAWARVRDWRVGQLQQKANVQMYLQSELGANDILEYGINHIVLATGAHWRSDGLGRHNSTPFIKPSDRVLTPDDLMADGIDAIKSKGPVVIFDDDRYYMASVLAEMIATAGFDTVFITPAAVVAPWTVHTLEQHRIQKRLMELGVDIICNQALVGVGNDSLSVECVYSAKQRDIPWGTLVSVTCRLPHDTLWNELQTRQHAWKGAGIKSVQRIGDSYSPGLIAAAVHAGHEYARNAQTETVDPPRR